MPCPRACSLPGVLLLMLVACDPSRPDLGGTESTAVTTAGARPAGAAPRDYRSIAAKVVEQSAGVRENDIVQISGNVEDLPLLEDIAIEVEKRGGHSLVTVRSERFGRRMYDEVPARYDARAPVVGRRLVEMIDVFIATEAGEGRTYQGVSPERQAARAKAFQTVLAISRKRGVRAVFLGNGLYPNDERAQQLGLSRDELAKLMYGGIDADYDRLQATGERLSTALAGGKELHITGPSGTDFKVDLAGRPVLVSDGVISPEDRKKGAGSLSVWLPAGEVYFTPAPNTGSGVLVADTYFYQGDRVSGLRLELRDGRLVGMTARSGLDRLRAFYEAADAGKDLLGVVDLGINTSLDVPEGKAVNVWSRAGAVTVSIGNNAWAGGDNNSSFAVSPEIARATVTVDGRPIVKDGKLVETPVASR